MQTFISNKKNILCIGTIVIMAIMILTLTITVNGANKDNSLKQHKYYDGLESEYKEAVDAVLLQHNLYYSGINMTRITDEDGARTYLVNIHNYKIEQMDAQEKCELINELYGIEFGDESVIITYDI